MKRVAMILVAITLVLGGLGGFAYAQTHEPVVGEKLIGYGPFGNLINEHSGEKEVLYTLFTFTNPDCKRDIIIERVSIIKADGTCIYDDQPFTTMKPHSVRLIRLVDYLGDASSISNPCRFYTVEVSWSARSKCLPLTGHAVVFQKNSLPSSEEPYTMSKTRVPMENVKQKR